MAESEVECFIGVKTAQNSKKEDRIERKNIKLCGAEGRRCGWGDFTPRKTRRMHHLLSEFNFKLAFRSTGTHSCCIHFQDSRLQDFIINFLKNILTSVLAPQIVVASLGRTRMIRKENN